MARTKTKVVYVWCQFCERANMAVYMPNGTNIKDIVRATPCPICYKNVLEIYKPKTRKRK